jgi:hypothetical protein
VYQNLRSVLKLLENWKPGGQFSAIIKSMRSTFHSAMVCLAVLAVLASGCKGGQTTPTPLPSTGQAFEVTGIVTDDQGVPLRGVAVTMRHYLGGFMRSPSVLTDASGGYTISFTASPWTDSNGSAAARADIITEGYEWYYRTVRATSSHLVEDFRLHRINRITAGDSIVLSVTSDNGTCIGWLYGPCARMRVAPLANGNLTIEGVPTQEGAPLPQLEVCCVSGNERGGNPVTIPVRAGTEVTVEVGQPSQSVTTSESVTVKTSFEPL